jgi:S-adenosylmethionine:diacylglycerol 3-amino-3-carboxypropyl transferase
MLLLLRLRVMDTPRRFLRQALLAIRYSQVVNWLSARKSLIERSIARNVS